MPSPFPGMDPYLENPEIFLDFHDSFITYLRENLQANLAAPYFAAIGRRTWIEVSRRSIGPDVEVRHAVRSTALANKPGGSVAIANPPIAQACCCQSRARRIPGAVCRDLRARRRRKTPRCVDRITEHFEQNSGGTRARPLPAQAKRNPWEPGSPGGNRPSAHGRAHDGSSASVNCRCMRTV